MSVVKDIFINTDGDNVLLRSISEEDVIRFITWFNDPDDSSHFIQKWNWEIPNGVKRYTTYLVKSKICSFDILNAER